MVVKVSPTAMIEGSIPQEATPPSQPARADTTLGPAKSVHLVCRCGCVGSHRKQASTSPLPHASGGGCLGLVAWAGAQPTSVLGWGLSLRCIAAFRRQEAASVPRESPETG